ncbi:toll/interleukin-1 receptor domain-containing protein [Flavobacterium sp.]|uniref:toll/interleukin-1 receptor domain-containing protein n=1 Tax=Flavobacterium sp. TaxID=239 RepID=UPI00260ED692|nr:toll/interleukin-1 receptor domain-containing protein [Flavobacterium sp.]
MIKPKIFISLDSRDRQIQNKLLARLEALNVFDKDAIFTSERGVPDEQFHKELSGLKFDPGMDKLLSEIIKKKIYESDIIILFVSPDLFSSKGFFDEELIHFLTQINQNNNILIPIITRPAPWNNVTALRNFKVWPREGVALSELDSVTLEIELTELATEISNLAREIEHRKLSPLINSKTESSTLKSIKSQKPALKVFISYAHKDENLKDELIEHLSGLKNTNIISDWTDREILGGEKWDERIKKNLEDSKIILFLVSASFMSSNYINEIEIQQSIKMHKKGDAVIIPIIIRYCDFKSLPLNEYQALPKNAKPIEDWKPRAKGWLDVVNQLKDIITKLKSANE